MVIQRRTQFWVAFWTIFGVGNFIASKSHNSLCEMTRYELRLHTPQGRTGFSVAFAFGMMLLHRHVLKPFNR